MACRCLYFSALRNDRRSKGASLAGGAAAVKPQQARVTRRKHACDCHGPARSIARPMDREAIMDTSDVAKAFAELCKAGKFEEAGERFWADDVVSLEPMEGPMARLEGRAAVKGKSEWWNSAHEVHSSTAEGPFAHGDQFAMRFAIDVTQRESGQRMQFTEIGLYTVRDGKVVEEKFLFGL
jgi:ketosteroid isomerase-like protein